MMEMSIATQSQRSMTVTDPAAIAAAESAKQRIQAAYIMAYQNPRDTDQARVKILQACKRPMFAERVEYAKPIGKDKITGPSVRFAELALREWGNVLSDIQVVYEDENIRRSKIIITDLETNTTFTKEISVVKTVERKYGKDREVISQRRNSYGDLVYIVKATDDELHNKEAALISKALRNEGLRLVPSDIIDEAIYTARETLANRDSQDPEQAKKRVIDGFVQLGIYPDDLKQYLGHSLEKLVPAELQDLRGMFQAISAGDAKWADYIQAKEPENPPENKPDPKKPAPNKADSLKDKIKRNQSTRSKDDEDLILTPPEKVEDEESEREFFL